MLAPFVKGDHVDPQRLGDLSHALAMGRPHPPADISLDGLAVTTHRSCPSSPLVVELVGMERRHLFWQRGETWAPPQTHELLSRDREDRQQ